MFWNEKKKNISFLYNLLPSMNQENFDAFYKYYKVYVVYACVNFIASCSSTIPVTENEFTKNPDGNKNWTLFIQTIVKHLMIFGNCFLEKQKDNRLLILDPLRVSVLDEKYRFANPNGNSTFIDKEKVLHMTFNCVTGVYGVGPIQALRPVIESLMALLRILTSILQNDGKPAGIVSFDEYQSPSQKLNILEEFANLSSNHRQQIAIIEGANFKFQKFGASMDELRISETINLLVEQICIGMCISPILLGIKQTTHENYKNIYNNNRKTFIKSLVDSIVSQINRFIGTEIDVLLEDENEVK